MKGLRRWHVNPHHLQSHYPLDIIRAARMQRSTTSRSLQAGNRFTRGTSLRDVPVMTGVRDGVASSPGSVKCSMAIFTNRNAAPSEPPRMKHPE